MSELKHIAKDLKEFNDMVEKGAPTLLPEIQRFLNNCKPVADMLASYFIDGRMQSIIRYETASQVALKLLEQGKDPATVAAEADRITRKLQSLTNK